MGAAEERVARRAVAAAERRTDLANMMVGKMRKSGDCLREMMILMNYRSKSSALGDAVLIYIFTRRMSDSSWNALDRSSASSAHAILIRTDRPSI
jgi:hypothetical protein